MEEDKITILAQLLIAIKESTNKLEKAVMKGNAEEIAIAKSEILTLQREIDNTL